MSPSRKTRGKVDQVSDTYSSDAEVSRRLLKETFAIVVSNIELVEKEDRTGAIEKFLDSITDDVENGRELQDWQRAKVDDIYERMMKAAGLPSVPVHNDRRRKGINYGHQGK